MLKLQVIGKLGKDATVNNVGGKNVINFSVAHSERYKDAQGTQQEKTTWVECAKWGESTAVAQYLVKGTQVFVEGTPEVRSYQAADGTTKSNMSIRVNQVELLGSKPTASDAAPTVGRQDAPAYNAPAPIGGDDDQDSLPF